MFPYDPQLLAATTGGAPVTLEDVVVRLSTIDGILGQDDGLKWFNRLYLNITQAVRTALRGGHWNDPAFIVQLDIDFAGLYFSALATYLADGSCPACWQTVFAARQDVRIARVQFAVAGINSHINHDLPTALVAASGQLQTPLIHEGPEHTDFIALNPVLDSQITVAEDQLKIRLDGGVIPALNILETRLAAWSLSAAREAAWTNGEVLAGLQAVPALADRYLATLDGLAEVVNKGLLVPPL